MKQVKIIYATVLLIIIVDICFGENKVFHQFVDKTIAGITVGEDYEQKVISHFGKGTLVQRGYALCYYFVQEDQSIIFGLGPDKLIEEITLSTEKRPDCRTADNKNKMMFRTKKGVQLGDPTSKVIKIYGEPDKRESGDEVLVFEYHTNYKKDAQVRLFYDAYLYFKKDKLIKIVIHDGE